MTSIKDTDLPNDLNEKVRDWLRYDTFEETRREIQRLCENEDWEELHKRMDKRITFGTAGLRGKMEAGFSRMNVLTVRQASQGLATYIQERFPENLSVVVGHDHRHNSKAFSKVTIDTFLQFGFKVYDLNEDEDSFVHTPLVPFSVTNLGASVGVMITASHNPKMDNGYKVYYANGCQIIPPHDQLIDKAIETSLVPLSSPKIGIVKKCKKDMTEKYICAIKRTLLENVLDRPCEPWFVYTPMHGVGLEIFEKVGNEVLSFKKDIDYICVTQQEKPDPEFPTVSFPNPEERGALDLAMRCADSYPSVHLVVANDPDADRFSVAVKENGTWKQLSGNDIGYLLAINELEKYKNSNIKEPLAMINSTVSSQMLRKVAKTENFHYEDTLTGFKWLGNRSLELEKEGYYVPFAYEEAIGYMFSSVVHDKDGISAAVVFLQAYLRWMKDGLKPLDILHHGFERYGYFKQFNGYYILPELSLTKQIFDDIRSIEIPHPTSIGTSIRITNFRDLTVGYQSDTPDNVPDLPIDASSQMITCELAFNNHPNSLVRVTIRGSGTEPKLKVYIESQAPDERSSTLLTKLTWDILRDEWFKPELTGLITPFE